MSKKILFVAMFIIFCTYTSVQAVEVLWSNITNYTSTKTNKTVPIEQVTPIKVTTAASTCKAYIDNANGTGAPIPANTFVDIKTPSNVSNIVFKCDSSTGTTVTVIK